MFYNKKQKIAHQNKWRLSKLNFSVYQTCHSQFGRRATEFSWVSTQDYQYDAKVWCIESSCAYKYTLLYKYTLHISTQLYFIAYL